MLTTEKINQLLGITESYQAPQVMLDYMLDDKKREELFRRFLREEKDLSYEWFHNYFEEEHADRKKKKQDFTPDAVSKLCAMLIDDSDDYFEAAAGTGGMLIQAWNIDKERYFIVEELSDRSIPFLLFNMAIRGINGTVRHGDSLKQKFKTGYELINNGNFSSIK
ncbi:N-6 DNA methylase [Tetragenococcus halophilus]|uniref:N-6 DNA methylase n=1 Tax=Tetragenococcus halophilus TaxID=51669 RepID=UPI00209AC314|nr:N-6 DNA methylase [Tetragenococcus halophilus]MCO8294881.1 N-6 DNA methylase [Tetragenococcus halophilus]